jgi:hypothetical protein
MSGYELIRGEAMPGNKSLRGASRRASRDLFFGSPPVLAYENLEAYEILLDRLYSEIEPRDFIEESLLHDAACGTWELLRLRRMKICLIEAAIPAAMVWVLAVPPHQRLEHVGPTKNEESIDPPMSKEDQTKLKELAANAAKKMEEVKKEAGLEQTAAQLAADFNLVQDTITTRAFLEKFDTVERIDRMIINAENRRNLVFREIDRHRSGLGSTWREKIRSVEDAEYKIVNPGRRRDKYNGRKNAA